MNTAMYSSSSNNAAAAAARRREELVSKEPRQYRHPVHHDINFLAKTAAKMDINVSHHHDNLFMAKTAAKMDVDVKTQSFKNSFNMSSILPNKYSTKNASSSSPLNSTTPTSDSDIKYVNNTSITITNNAPTNKSTAIEHVDSSSSSSSSSSPFAMDPDWWIAVVVNRRDSASGWLDRMLFLPNNTASASATRQTRSTAATRRRRGEKGAVIIRDTKMIKNMLLSRSKTRRLIASILNGRSDGTGISSSTTSNRVPSVSAANQGPTRTTCTPTNGPNAVGGGGGGCIKRTATNSRNHDCKQKITPSNSNSSKQFSLKGDSLDEKYPWPVEATTDSAPLNQSGGPSQLLNVSYTRFSSSSSLASLSPCLPSLDKKIDVDTSKNAVHAQDPKQQQAQTTTTTTTTTNSITQDQQPLAPPTMTTAKIQTSIKRMDCDRDKGTSSTIPLVIFVVKQRKQQRQSQQTLCSCKNANSRTLTTTTTATRTSNSATTIRAQNSQGSKNASNNSIDELSSLNSSFKSSRRNYFHDINDNGDVDECQSKPLHCTMNDEVLCRRPPTSNIATSTRAINSGISLLAAPAINKSTVKQLEDHRQQRLLGFEKQTYGYGNTTRNKRNEDSASVSTEDDYASSFSENDASSSTENDDDDEYSSFAPSDYSITHVDEE